MGEDPEKVTMYRVSIGFLFVIGAGLMAPLGAWLGTLWSKETREMVPLSLAFAAGVLIWVALAGIHVEALESFQTRHSELRRLYTLICIIFGVIAGELLDYSMRKLGYSHTHSGNHNHSHSQRMRYQRNQMFEIDEGSQEEDLDRDGQSNTIIEDRMLGGIPDEKEELGMNVGMSSSIEGPIPTASSSSTNQSIGTELSEAAGIKETKELSEIDRSQMMEVSTITCIAVSIHNFPEGLATFASAVAHPRLGFLVSIAVALHNLPLGIAVGMPVYIASGSRWKAVLWAGVCGLSALIGGLLGWAVVAGGRSGNITGVLFGFTVGIMLWTAFKELIPEARSKDPEDRYTFYLIFIGIVVMDLSMILLDVIESDE